MNKKEDKLIFENEKIRNHLDYIKSYQNGRINMKSKNYAAAKNIFENCLIFSENNNDKIKQMDTLISLGYSQLHLNQYQDSAYSLSKSLEICENYLNDSNNIEKNNFSKYNFIFKSD